MKRLMALLLCCLLAVSTALAEGTYTVTLPGGYAEGDPLPVYRALERNQKQANFFDKVDPAWFNASGVAKSENGSKRARYDCITFQDGAELTIDTSNIRYEERDGTRMVIYDDDPEHPEGPFPRDSFAVSIGKLASNAFFFVEHEPPETVFARDALTGITLDEAVARVQALLAHLELDGYECVQKLDMSVERIHELGRWEAERLRVEYVCHNDPEPDFSLATEADEGYYLRFEKRLYGVPVQLMDTDPFHVVAFVNARGVAYFNLTESYALQEVYSTPDHLLTSAQAAACWEKDTPRRQKHGLGETDLTDMELRYVPVRAANKKDGVVLTPAWYITYRSEVEGPGLWAWYSAEDGRLLMDAIS